MTPSQSTVSAQAQHHQRLRGVPAQRRAGVGALDRRQRLGQKWSDLVHDGTGSRGVTPPVVGTDGVTDACVRLWHIPTLPLVAPAREPVQSGTGAGRFFIGRKSRYYSV